MVDAADKEKPGYSAECSGKNHRADDDFIYIDSSVARSIPALAYDCDFIAVLRIILININKDRDDNRYDNREQVSVIDLRQPAGFRLRIDDTDIS